MSEASSPRLIARCFLSNGDCLNKARLCSAAARSSAISRFGQHQKNTQRLRRQRSAASNSGSSPVKAASAALRQSADVPFARADAHVLEIVPARPLRGDEDIAEMGVAVNGDRPGAPAANEPIQIVEHRLQEFTIFGPELRKRRSRCRAPRRCKPFWARIPAPASRARPAPRECE